ncbi:MAG: hypothetical protein AB8B91_00445 [Rubripirellula sp.]
MLRTGLSKRFHSPAMCFIVMMVVYSQPSDCGAQVTIPETNLAPIGQPSPFASGNQGFAPNPSPNFAPSPGFTPSPTGPPSTGFAAPPTGFDPYASTPRTGFGGLAPNLGGIAPGLGLGQNPGSNVTVIGPPAASGPSAVIGPPSAAAPGTIAPSPPGGGLLNRLFSRPASSPSFGVPSFGTPIPNQGFSQPGSLGGSQVQGPVFQAPMYGQPGGFDNGNVYGPPAAYGPGSVYGAPGSYGSSGGFGTGGGFPSSAYPSSSPSTLFPGGIFSGGVFGGGAGTQGRSYRLFQGPRLRHTYVAGLGGSDPDDLDTNDTDVSLVFAFPNFMYSTQPLYVVPSFSLHLWDGPNNSTTADLPGSAYSGFLDVGWNSDPNQMFGTEFGVRVGAFTDFDTFNSDSIRTLGKALVNFRLTPASTVKAGVYYIDRNKIKLVPAGGILYQPNPYTRLDLFFPQPKLSRYWRTVGTRDVWGYIGGDYGGGSWTIKRDNGVEDSVDINEIRLTLGMEWGTTDFIRAGRRTGFFEIGYAFDREVEYRKNSTNNIKPSDGIMFRAGIGY